MIQRERRPARNGTAHHQRPELVPQLTAGVTLNAAAALVGGQQLFTRDQVAYLLALAYDSGRTAQHLDDIAEIHCTGIDRATARKRYADRVASRLAEMQRHAAQLARKRGQPAGYVYAGGPVDWQTGRPVALRQEEAA